VSFAATGVSVSEGDGTQNVTLEISPAPTANITVNYAVNEPRVSSLDWATVGSDFSITGLDTSTNLGTVTVPANSSSVTIPVVITDDSVSEGAELMELTLKSGAGYTLNNPKRFSFVIGDDDPGLLFSATSLTVEEGSSATYTVRLGTEPTGTVTVTVGGATGDVTVDTDPDTNGNQNTLSFTTSNFNWSRAETVTVSAGEDADATDDSATLSHSASGGGYNSVTGNVAVTVTDDDTPRSP